MVKEPVLRKFKTAPKLRSLSASRVAQICCEIDHRLRTYELIGYILIGRCH